ncbi:c-type cytochrome [Roseibaca sp. Y0-43]|uniref:c-type cytochrome n=1 Tax=Roseibaca sp. Y0-43 TaxID=2816854 RepID=UPI001D0C2A96|nr:cytochrome C [Roseibaca sp. Y0-43]MCC1480757.1 cytochrome C [Roseibaca sp. Y0-43]
MKPVFLALCGLVLSSAPALADESLWRDCRTCHRVEAPDGTVLARGGRAGPNLYGVAGRALAGDSEFRLYSRDLEAAARTGARWTRDNFVAYLAGPDQFLRAMTGSELAQSGMHVAHPSGGDALFRYLSDLSN